MLAKYGIHDYIVLDREHLNTYTSVGEVVLIMNGWYQHNLNGFPPPPNIKPILLSFHTSNRAFIQQHHAWFKHHEPIGCRDQSTVELFQQVNIKAYFTGCLTLTFDTVPKSQKYPNLVVVVDANRKVGKPTNADHFLRNYQNATFFSHGISTHPGLTRTGFKKREEVAKGFLDIYAYASLVITSRLHVALPARALGTDVLFAHRFYQTDPRFEGLQHVIHGGMEYHLSRRSIDPKIINTIRASVSKVFHQLVMPYLTPQQLEMHNNTSSQGYQEQFFSKSRGEYCCF
mmetsp:Transcript_14391/g.21544  ORF Transcript_14391/g.21544 Transcript_14391/m.21544 type:complete len:287 (-) Transcript_14391:35-895(-)